MRQSSVDRVKSSGKAKSWLALALTVHCLLITDDCFSGPGKDGFLFLDETTGARAAALGEATSAPGDEANGAFHNPALAAEARQPELALGYSGGPAGVTRGSAAYLHPLRNGAMLAGLRNLSSGKITAYDGNDIRLGETEAQDTVLSLGYGRMFGARSAWGLSAVQISEKLADDSATAAALNAGVLIRPSWAPMRLSIAVRNLGGQASFGREKTSLPRSFDAGLAYQGFADAFTAVAEFHKPRSADPSLRLGGELWVYNALALRTGYAVGRDLGTGFTLGAGFKFGALRVDYAFSAQDKGFEDSHKAGIRFLFGGPAEKAYQEGLRLSRRGRPAEAILKFEEALDADPRHPGAVRSLREAVKTLEREMREQDDAGQGGGRP